MLVQARKNPKVEIVRYPDCIYSNERYYRSTFPVLEPKRRRAINAFLDSRRENQQSLVTAKGRLAATEAELQEMAKKENSSECRIRELEAQKSAAEEEFGKSQAEAEAARRRIDELAARLSKAEAELHVLERKAESSKHRIRELEVQKSTADEECGKLKAEAEAARRRIDELVAQLSEALFLCDRYLAKVSATDAQLKELRARAGVSGGRIRELEAAEARLQAILNSTSWRLTGPLRRIMTAFPRFRFVIRLIFAPLWRVGRVIGRGAG
jgi:chromosome segregation ATPase